LEKEYGIGNITVGFAGVAVGKFKTIPYCIRGRFVRLVLNLIIFVLMLFTTSVTPAIVVDIVDSPLMIPRPV